MPSAGAIDGKNGENLRIGVSFHVTGMIIRWQ